MNEHVLALAALEIVHPVSILDLYRPTESTGSGREITQTLPGTPTTAGIRGHIVTLEGTAENRREYLQGPAPVGTDVLMCSDIYDIRPEDVLEETERNRIAIATDRRRWRVDRVDPVTGSLQIRLEKKGTA